MELLRRSIAALLLLLVALTGQGAAFARGMPPVADVVEICGGNGPVMIAVDAGGQPAGIAHLCPEFALTLLDVIALTTPDVAAPDVAASLIVQVSAFSQTCPVPRSPMPRGPPVPV